MVFDRSELNLDRPATVVEKLGLTVLFLTLGGFFFIFTCLVFAGDGDLWWKIPAQIAIEICWTFWVLGLLFVWWRPALLRRFYLSAERRMMRLARVLVWIAVVLFVFALVLVGVLIQFEILPVRPK
jgi:hypothetical protein